MAFQKIDTGKAAAPKASKKEDTKITVTPTPEVVKLVDSFIRLEQKAKAFSGAVETVKAQLREVAVPDYFTKNAGQHTPLNMTAHGTGLNEALIAFTNRYTACDQEQICEILADNPKALDLYFQSRLTVKVDQKALDAVSIDKKQEIADAINAMTKKLGLPDGLFTLNVVAAPTEAFHEARHTALSVEENLAIQDVMPCVQMVKTRTANTLTESEAAALAKEIEDCQKMINEGEALGFGKSDKSKAVKAAKVASRRAALRTKGAK